MLAKSPIPPPVPFYSSFRGSRSVGKRTGIAQIRYTKEKKLPFLGS